MKKVLTIILLLTTIFLLTGCTQSDSIKFKKEYESLNNVKNEYNRKTKEIKIDRDNVIVYKNALDIVEMINNKETFVVYFGFASCPWCRNVVPTLLEVSKNLNLKSLYYVDISDIRDTKEVVDGEVKTIKEGSKSYNELVSLLGDVLSDYELLDLNNEKVNLKEKRIYAPNVISIVDGSAKAITTGISDAQSDPYTDVTNEMKEETYNKFKAVIEKITENKTCKMNEKC